MTLRVQKVTIVVIYSDIPAKLSTLVGHNRRLQMAQGGPYQHKQCVRQVCDKRVHAHDDIGRPQAYIMCSAACSAGFLHADQARPRHAT